MESESRQQAEVSGVSRFLRWVASGAAKRYALPGLVAYYWTSGSPKSCSVGNISSSGMYVFTDEHWLPGSVMPMTLQQTDCGQDGEEWIAVLTRVVRSGLDGFGLAFVFSGSASMFGNAIPSQKVADEKTLKRFIRHLK